jgi:hypothetical protein
MAKYTLQLDTEFDYELIGVCSHHQDYRVSWELNQYAGFDFQKCDDDFRNYTRKSQLLSSHSMYASNDEDTGAHYLFIKNKSQGKFLLPELSQIDFFIFAKDHSGSDMEELLELVRKAPTVLTAFAYDPAVLKSCEQLIVFD